MGPGVDGRATTCTGPITSTARTTDSRLTNRRIAPPHAHFYNRDADVTRVGRATVPEPTTRSQATNADDSRSGGAVVKIAYDRRTDTLSVVLKDGGSSSLNMARQAGVQ